MVEQSKKLNWTARQTRCLLWYKTATIIISLLIKNVTIHNHYFRLFHKRHFKSAKCNSISYSGKEKSIAYIYYPLGQKKKKECKKNRNEWWVIKKWHDHLKEYWISSNVFPFVSGTQITTKATVSTHMAAYIVNVPVHIDTHTLNQPEHEEESFTWCHQTRTWAHSSP